MGIVELIDKKNIILDVEANSKIDVFEVLAKSLYDTKIINNINGFVQAVLERENEYSTGIGFEIAIPHAKSKYVNKPAIAVARLKKSIEYESIDEEPVSLLFMIAVPESRNDEHLKILSILARRFMDSDFREKLKSAKSKEQIFDVLNVV